MLERVRGRQFRSQVFFLWVRSTSPFYHQDFAKTVESHLPGYTVTQMQLFASDVAWNSMEKDMKSPRQKGGLERWILRLKMILDRSEKSSTLGHCNLKILKEYGFITI